MTNPRVNRWLDLLDRVGWTAVQVSAGVIFAMSTSGDPWSWSFAGKAVLGAVIVATAKVIVGQRTGTDDTGSLIGTPVIEPPPEGNP